MTNIKIGLCQLTLLLTSIFILTSCGENFHLTTNNSKISFSPIKTTFVATGVIQDVIVPAGATTLTVKAWGAGGGGGRAYNSVLNYGGPGAFISAKFNVSSLTSVNLKVVVGDGGAHWNNSLAQTSAFLNGGTTGTPSSPATSAITCSNGKGAGGGGLVGVFVDFVLQANGLVVVGSGGGASNSNGTAVHVNTSRGGLGGTPSLAATSGSNSIQGAGTNGGLFATISAGGAGGSGAQPGEPGLALAGGNAGQDARQCSGGGGAGYFGGGGGGSSSSFNDSAGGGGSGFVAAIGTTLSEAQGSGLDAANNTSPDYIAGVGVGGDTDSNGGDGLVILEWE